MTQDAGIARVVQGDHAPVVGVVGAGGRRKRILARFTATLLAAVVAVPTLIAPSPALAQAQACEFQLGFATLKSMIPAQVGDCLENEWHNAENGDALQRTTNGMLVWRKLDNWTAFTDGHVSYVNGPFGLQARLNTERFVWEPVGVPAAIQPEADDGIADRDVVPPEEPAPVVTPENERPTIRLRVSDDRVDNGEKFTIRIEAKDDHGIDRVWWWATNTDDDNLRRTRSTDCDEVTPCNRSWTVSTEHAGTVVIRAVARDSDGLRSSEARTEVRVRRPVTTPTEPVVPPETDTPATPTDEAPEAEVLDGSAS